MRLNSNKGKERQGGRMEEGENQEREAGREMIWEQKRKGQGKRGEECVYALVVLYLPQAYPRKLYSPSSSSAKSRKPWGRTILRKSWRKLWKILEAYFPDNV